MVDLALMSEFILKFTEMLSRAGKMIQRLAQSFACHLLRNNVIVSIADHAATMIALAEMLTTRACLHMLLAN